MINIVNTIYDNVSVKVESEWFSKDEKIEYIGELKDKIKSDHYLVVKLTYNGLTANQRVCNSYLNISYKNAFNDFGVKVIKCNDAVFNETEICNMLNSLTGNEPTLENILVKGTATNLEIGFSIFTIDLSNISKNVTYDNNSIIIAINFQFGLTDDFTVYDPQSQSGLYVNPTYDEDKLKSNCEAVITEIVGLNSTYKYDRFSILDCGTAYLNLASGKNIYSKTLLSSASNKMPIIFSVYQNADNTDNNDNVGHLNNKVFPSFYYRIYQNGMNYEMEDATGLKSCYIHRDKLSFTDEYLKEKYKTKVFSTGEIYYSPVGDSYIHVNNESDKRIVYLYDKKDNYMKFIVDYDKNGEYTLIQEVGDSRGNKLNYYWDDKYLLRIENTADEVMEFTYVDNYIDKVTISSTDQCVQFEYLDNNTLLLKTYFSLSNPKLINETCLYFNGESTLRKIEDYLTKYYLEFSYDSEKRVKKVGSYNNTGEIKQYEVTYLYTDKYTKATDLKGNYIYYYFNNYGFLQLVMDNNGKSITYNYDEFEYGVSKKLSGVSKIQNNSRNLIQNHSFENDEIFATNSLGWKKMGDEESKVSVINDGVIGNKCLKIISSTNDTVSVWQDIGNVTTGTYNFKGFIKNPNLSAENIDKINLYVAYKYNLEAQTEMIEKIKRVTLDKNEEAWYEFSEQINDIPTDAYNISVKIGIEILQTEVEIYLDDLQLITNSYYIRSNLIENGYMDFIDSNNHPIGWTLLNCDNDDQVVSIESDDLHLDILGKQVFKICAKNLELNSDNEYKNKVIYKRIPINGKKGDQLTLSVFAKSNLSLKTTLRSFIRFINVNTDNNDYIFDFEKNLDDWQMLTRSISAVDDYSAVIVGVEYIGSDDVLLDCFQLYKESFGTIIKYDSDGNIIGIDSGNGITKRYSYDDNGNITEAYNDDGSYYQYEYDENDLLIKTRDMYGNTLTLEYDSDDRVTLQTLRTFDGEIFTTTHNYDDINNTETFIDEFGLKKISKMDKANRIMSQTLATNNLETQQDEVYSEINYSYHDNSLLKNFYTVIKDIKYGNTLTYDDFGNINTVQSENGTLYNLDYDTFGKLTSVKINDYTLENNHYNTPLSQYYKSKLDGMTLGANCDYYELIYNDLDQVKEIKLNNETIATYSYDENGNVYKLTMFNNDVSKNMYFTYDLKGRLLKLKTSDNQEFKYTYDNLGNIQTKVYNINDTIRSIGYQYGYENNQLNKYNLIDRVLRKYGDDIVYNSPSGKGSNGAKPTLNTCTNFYDEELGLNLINFNDKYDFINYKMSTFNSFEGNKYKSWKSKFDSNKTFFMLIKPTGSFALENLFSFGIIDENISSDNVELKSHLAVNTSGKIVYYNSSPSSPIATSSGTLKLNEWNLVGIQFKKPLIGSNKVKIFLNTTATSFINIDESVKDLNYLIVGYQSTLNSSNTGNNGSSDASLTTTSNNGSSDASSTTTSDLTMPFKIGLMSFGAYDYENDDFKNLYSNCKKYLGNVITYKVNSTVYYDSLVYKGFDVITLNGTLDSSLGLKPYETPEIDASYKIEKPQIFKYDEELNKFVYSCYKEQERSLKYILPLKEQGTITLRFKSETLNKSRTIFSLKKYNTEICKLTINSNNKINFWYNDNLKYKTNVSIIENEIPITNSNWHSVAMVYDQNNLCVFVDNVGLLLYNRNECVNLEGAIISLGNSFNEDSSLYGCIEMFAYSEQYKNNAVLNKIMKKGMPIIVYDEYDTIGRLRKNIINNKNKSFKIEYEYDKTRLNKQSFWNGNEISYEYDTVGNIEKICYNDNESCINYKYNELGMLEEEILADGTITSYTYDENCNIKTKRSILNDVVILDEEYKYDDVIKDRLMEVINKLTDSISKHFDYDSNNEFYPSSINGEQLIWEGKLLKSYKGHTFEYDSNGIRTKIIKRNSSSEIVKTTSFVLEGTNIISMTINELNREYKLDFTYDANSKLIGLSTIQGNYFYVRDVIGNIIGLIDSNGNFVIEYKYDAWGNLLRNLPYADDNTATIAAKYNPFIYKGYYYDVETGWFWLSSRYYSPELCRFISPDDIEYLDPESVNGLNLYCYCKNNPIMYTDPSGHLAFSVLLGIGIAVGAIIGGSVSVVSQGIENGWDNIDWRVVAVDAVFGAIDGALSVTGMGALASLAINPMLAGAQVFVTDLVTGDLGANTFEQIMVSMAFSMVMVGASSALSKFAPIKVGYDGINNAGIYNTSKGYIATAKSAKKIAMYKAKQSLVKKTILQGTGGYALFTASQNFTSWGLNQLLGW